MYMKRVSNVSPLQIAKYLLIVVIYGGWLSDLHSVLSGAVPHLMMQQDFAQNHYLMWLDLSRLQGMNLI